MCFILFMFQSSTYSGRVEIDGIYYWFTDFQVFKHLYLSNTCTDLIVLFCILTFIFRLHSFFFLFFKVQCIHRNICLMHCR